VLSVAQFTRSLHARKDHPVPVLAVYQLKAMLTDSHPPIWRRLMVHSNITLAEMHRVLQVAFDWYDYHLHMFTAGGVEYGVPHPDDFREVKDERRTPLNSLLRKPKDRLDYEYDFGDSWHHRIVLEKILPAEPQLELPACTGGRRASPPEDSGGVWGYKRFLEALADPDHPDHEMYSEWIGGTSFESEAFDPKEINAMFREIW
jgi:hypothetical protein